MKKIILDEVQKPKLFISCPMKGRTEEAIRRSIAMMHKMAESYFGVELEIIQSYADHNPPKDANQAVWYLGRSLQMLSEAEYFVGIESSVAFKGCNFEKLAVQYYMKIPALYVDYRKLMPDAAAVEDEIGLE